MDLAKAEVAQLMIPVDDFERGSAFYRDTLGIPLLFAAPPQMAFFQSGTVRLLVGVLPMGQKAARGSAIYFRVEDIDSVYKTLKDRGVHFVAEATYRESHRQVRVMAGRVYRSGWKSACIAQ